MPALWVHHTAFYATIDKAMAITTDNMIASILDNTNVDACDVQLILQSTRQLPGQLTIWTDCMFVWQHGDTATLYVWTCLWLLSQ